MPGSKANPLGAAAMKASPVCVVGPGVGGLPPLRETGFCVYDLQRMHDEAGGQRARRAPRPRRARVHRVRTTERARLRCAACR